MFKEAYNLVLLMECHCGKKVFSFTDITKGWRIYKCGKTRLKVNVDKYKKDWFLYTKEPDFWIQSNKEDVCDMLVIIPSGG